MKTAEIMLDENIESQGFLNSYNNHVESATFAMLNASETAGTPAQRSPRVSPDLSKSFAKQISNASQSPRNSHVGFSSSRNRTIGSKNKNY